MLASMDAFQSVSLKMYRARHHYEELVSELLIYYRILATPEGDLTEEEIKVRAMKVPPQRFGLIVGDCLQCLRSSLDYLVWELVLAKKTTVPGSAHQFPISNKEKGFSQQLKRGRLKGVDSDAQALIASIQPYHHPEPEQHPLAVLESLTNINKHRSVLLTMFSAYTTEPPIIFPRMHGTIVEIDFDDTLRNIPVWGWVSVQDGVADQMDIAMLVDSLARHLVEEVFPLFKNFLK